MTRLNSLTLSVGCVSGLCRIVTICALALMMALAPQGLRQAQAQDGAALLDAVDRVRAPGNHFTFDIELQDQSGVQLELKVMVRDRSKGLVRYVSPVKVAGRSILYVGRSMWVYVPGSRRELRISPQQQVLGGVASADIARIVYSADYEVVSSSDGPKGLRILHLKSRGNSAAYAKIDLAVNPSNSHPIFAEFYASNGKRKIKTLHFEGYKQVLGRLRPMAVRVVDHLDGDKVTRMKYSNMRPEETPAAWYQPSFLNKLK
jgi:outer membrane lipoprotein-sorting protein